MALADEYAPAPGDPPSLAPCSSQSQPALHSDPGSSASCRPRRGDMVCQQPKKPARSKRRKSMGDRGVAATLAPFLGHVLRPFPLGLGLPKLLEAVRQDHDLDLTALSQEAGYKDVLGLLGQVPGIWLHKSSRRRTYTVHLHAAADESAAAPGGPPRQQPITASPVLGSWVLCLLLPRKRGPGTPAAEEMEIHGRRRCGCHPRPLFVERPAPLPPGLGAAQTAGGCVAGPRPGPGGTEPGSRV